MSVSIDKDEQTFSFKVIRGGEMIIPESVECARFFDKHANAIARRKIKQAVNRQITTLLDRVKLPKEIKYIAEINGIRIAVNEALRGSEWQLRSKEEIEAYNQAIKNCQQVIDQLRRELNGDEV